MTVLFTHVHCDHIIGFPFFNPLYYQDRIITVYNNPTLKLHIKKILKNTVKSPNFPVNFHEISANIRFKKMKMREFELFSLKILPIPLSHPNGGTGFRIREGDKTFVFLTDNELKHIHSGGCGRDELVDYCRHSDLLIYDSEYYDSEYRKRRKWGHSTIEDAVTIGSEAKVKSLGLFHHNQRRTDDEIDKMVEYGNSLLVEKGSDARIFGAAVDQEINL